MQKQNQRNYISGWRLCSKWVAQLGFQPTCHSKSLCFLPYYDTHISSPRINFFPWTINHELRKTPSADSRNVFHICHFLNSFVHSPNIQMFCTVIHGEDSNSRCAVRFLWIYSHLWRNFSYVWRKANPARRTLTFSSSPRYSTWCRQRSSSNICGDFLSLGLMQRT